MPVVKDSERKNAFSHRLKDKPKQSPEMGPEMTADEVKVAEKAYRDVGIGLHNLSVAIRHPSEKQAEMINALG